MSGKAAGHVWDLALPHQQQFVLLAMADHADHDGGSIYPSVGQIAWKTGYSVRTVQRTIRALEDKGILILDAEQHGKSNTRLYHIDWAKTSEKLPYKGGDKMSGVTPESHRGGDTQMTPGGDSVVSPNPSVTSDQPSEDLLATSPNGSSPVPQSNHPAAPDTSIAAANTDNATPSKESVAQPQDTGTQTPPPVAVGSPSPDLTVLPDGFPHIVNFHNVAAHWNPNTQQWDSPDYVYIGRANKTMGLPASKWANPYPVKRESERDDVITAYTGYLLGKPELVKALPELWGKTLVCWCSPKACHGEVLRRFSDPRMPVDQRDRMIAAAGQYAAEHPDKPKIIILPEVKDQLAIICYGTSDAWKIPANASAMGAVFKQLGAVTLGQLDKFDANWRKCDFRGQKGQRPKPHQVVAEWLTLTVSPTVEQHRTAPASPASTPTSDGMPPRRNPELQRVYNELHAKEGAKS